MIAALAEDSVAAVVGALSEGARTRTELIDRAEVSESTVRSVTRRLEDLGLVAGERQAPGGRGRPSRRYELRDASALAQFAVAARELDRTTKR